jgi:hypothetical protein
MMGAYLYERLFFPHLNPGGLLDEQCLYRFKLNYNKLKKSCLLYRGSGRQEA